MKRRAFLLALFAGGVWAQERQTIPTTGADLAQAVRTAGLDPEECYAVRDLAFSRDGIKFYLNDGFLIFSKPVRGERLSAVFASYGEDRADGELLLLPPSTDERRSLAKFTQTPNLDEHFETALLSFTDGSAQRLRDEIARGRERRCAEEGPALAERWNSSVMSLNGSLVQRIVADLLTPVRRGGGFLFVALENRRIGNFDVIFDPLADDQILAGRLAPHGTYASYDVWTSFESPAVRLGTAGPVESAYNVQSYNITAALDAALLLKATTRERFTVGSAPGRVLHFGISRAERVTSAVLDGVPVEVVFEESDRERALRADENELFLVVAPTELAPGSAHEIVIEHEGDVIADRGANVYAVGARSNWYPRLGMEFADYELEFRYPKGLTLVTAGDVVDDRTDGDFRVTRRKTAGPVRVAGFNLGNYARVSHTADGLTVDVYGNKGLDPALVPQARATVLPAPRLVYRGAPVQTGPATTIIQTPQPPDPLGRLGAVAADVSESLRFFAGMFGPPALNTLTVSPIPGTQGQGFPGLIYLSTLSYLEEAQRPENARDARQKTFFSDLMVAHEVAHQWWGNVVAPLTYRDEWIVEALAHYSALMWLEKKRGAPAMQAELSDFRIDLLGPGEGGGTLDSYGPLTWGYRLEAAHSIETWRVITYEKGAWVFHMLRRRLGEERFLKLLAELRKRHEYKAVSTLDLQNLVREIGAPDFRANAVEAFFDSWVRSTGIPSVRVQTSTSGRAPNVRVSGTVRYEQSSQRAVFGDFETEIPLEVQLPGGVRRIEWVRSGEQPEAFSFTLPQVPARIGVAGGSTLATQR